MASLLSSGDPTLEQISSYLATSSDLSFDNSYYFASDYFNGSYNSGIRSFKVYFWDPTQNAGQKWVQKYSQTSSQSNFGHQIACTWDADRFVVGSPDENKVYVYHSPGGSDSQKWTHNASGVAVSPTVHTISCPDSGSRRFGWSVAIAKDLGNHIVIGAPGTGNNGTDTTGLERGKVYIYEFNGTSWSKTFEKTANQANTDCNGNTGNNPCVYQPQVQQKPSGTTSGQAFYRVTDSSPQFGYYVDISGYGEYIAIGVPGTGVPRLRAQNMNGYSGGIDVLRSGVYSDYIEDIAMLGCIICYKTSNTSKSWASNTSLHGEPVLGQTEMSLDAVPGHHERQKSFDFTALGTTCKISLDGNRLIGGSPRYSYPGMQASPHFGRLDAWNYSTNESKWVLGKGRVVGHRTGNRLGMRIAVDYTGQRVAALLMKEPDAYDDYPDPNINKTGLMVYDWNGNGFYEVIPEIQTNLGTDGHNVYASIAISKGDIIAAYSHSNQKSNFYFYKLTGGYDGNSLVGGYCAADTFLVGPNDGSTQNTFKKQIRFGGTFFDNTYENTTIENRIYHFDSTVGQINHQGYSELLLSKKTTGAAPDMIRFKANELRIDNYVSIHQDSNNTFFSGVPDGEYDHYGALVMNVAGNFKINPEYDITRRIGSTQNVETKADTQAEVKAALDVEGDIFGRRRINAGYLTGQRILGRKWPWQLLYDTRSGRVKQGDELISNTFCEFNTAAAYRHGRIYSKGTKSGTMVSHYENQGALKFSNASDYIHNTDDPVRGTGGNGLSGSLWIKLVNEHSTYPDTNAGGCTLVSYGTPHSSNHTGMRFQIVGGTNPNVRFMMGSGAVFPTNGYTFTKDKWYHLYYALKPNPGSGQGTIQNNTDLWINGVAIPNWSSYSLSGGNYSGDHYIGSPLGDTATNIYIGMVTSFNSHINHNFHGGVSYVGQFPNATEMYNWGSPQEKLAVGGDAFIENRLSIGTSSHSPNYTLDVNGDINMSSGSSFRINGVAQSFGGTSSSAWTTSGTDVYRSAGKVGIGTSSPGYVLDVAGDINMSTGSSFRINGVAQTFGGGGSGGSSVWSTSGSDVYRSGGNVGIGTNSPSAPLHVTASGGSNPSTNGLYVYNESNFNAQDAIVTCRVAGTSAGDPYISFDVNGEAGWSWGMDNSDTNKMKLATNWDSLSNNTQMTIDRSGNVGIGTSSPSGPLHIYESTGTSRSYSSGTLILDHGNSGGSSCIIFPSRRNTNSDYGYIQYEDSTSSGDQKSRLIIGNENDASGTAEDNVILAPSGKVGIGTNTPAYLLDVNGDINIAGGSSLRIGGVAQSFGGGGGSSLSGTNTFEWGTGVSGKETNAGKIGYSTWSSGTNDALDIIGAGTSSSNRAVRIWDKLGIGTSSPEAMLHVKRETSSGESNVYIQSYSDGTGDQAALFLGTPHHNSTTSQPKCAIIADAIGWSRADLHFCVETTANNGSAYRASTGNSRMMIDGQTGYVGIGTTNPTKALFVVNGTGNSTNLGTYGWLNQSGGTSQASGSTYYSIHANNRIAGSEFNAHSDSRIKKNVVDINDSSALDKLRLLEPKIYNYIDEKQRGTSNVYGFIAQEVSNVLPYAVTVGEGDIPNILTNSNVSVTSDSNVLELHLDTAVEGLTLSNTSNINITTDKDKYLTVPVLSFSGSNVITIQNNQYFSNVTSAYIHGEQVSNFHNLNKDAIWAVSTSALQEVDRQLQAEKTKVATLETQVADLISRITALENA
tara:strand:+ start:968 stop:6172 length:5205 start_codon:yes stop_codon:yes gene_type:complete